MATPIHLEVLDSAEVVEFSKAAERLCRLIESVDSQPKAFFLEQLKELVPFVYSSAHRLTDPYNWNDDEDDDYEAPLDGRIEVISSAEHQRRFVELRARLGRKMGEHRTFRLIYDPVDPEDGEVIEGDLAQLVTEIYLDLKKGLLLYERSDESSKAEACYKWWFDFRHHWGAHAAEAMLPLHRLMHTHYDEDDEVFDL